MIRLMPLIAFSGISGAVQAGVFVPMMINMIKSDSTYYAWSDAQQRKNCL